MESIQGEGGYIVPSSGFFPTLRKLCDRYGILLIADEVQSGVGRTGKMSAIENFGVEPDIFCAAKGIASGMPLGVYGCPQRNHDRGCGEGLMEIQWWEFPFTCSSLVH